MEGFRAFIEPLAMLAVDARSAVLILLLVIASVSDCRSYRIPNWLTMGGAAFGLIYNAVFPITPDAGLLWALSGFALGLTMLLPLHALRAMGAGDVKLMAMAGAFLGPAGAFYAVIFSLIAGGAVALGFALYHRALGRMLGNVKRATALMALSAMAGMKPDASMAAVGSVGRIPYGVSISIGTIAYVAARQLGYL